MKTKRKPPAEQTSKVHGVEVLFGLEKMNILQCQKLAEDIGYDSARFDLCGPKGKIPCQWVDAYFGFFKKVGDGGFMIASQFQFAPDIWCENLRANKESGA